MLEIDHPRVEFLILAEYVEAMHGKLYLMGGGWETIHVPPPDVPVPVHLAVSVLVPWQATNQPHLLVISFQSADGETLAEVERQVTVGRPAGIEPGAEQRQIFAFRVPVAFPSWGTYVALARVNEAAPFRVSFRAIGHGYAP